MSLSVFYHEAVKYCTDFLHIMYKPTLKVNELLQ